MNAHNEGTDGHEEEEEDKQKNQLWDEMYKKKHLALVHWQCQIVFLHSRTLALS